MLLTEFLTTSFQNVQSPKRTEVLHKVLLDEILNSKHEWAEYDWDYEVVIEDGFGGTFKVDIIAYDSNGDIKIIILDKAYQSSVTKNMKNFSNTTIGESARVYFSPLCKNIEKILFVSVMPRVAPIFTNKDVVKGFDNVVAAKGRSNIDPILQQQYGGVVEIIDLFYDIEDVRMKSNRSDFDVIEVTNLDELVVA
tara:strand:+ start:727 stop:1311 length:585 start_codon:yes stop_codon:yes gene_type:complete